MPIEDANVPSLLKKFPNWVLYGKKKIPLKIDLTNASSTNPKHWTDFNTAMGCYVCGDPRLQGVGFVFTLDTGIVGVDLDDAFKKDGSLKGWALQIVTRLSSYTELSPSGKGLHILLKGKKKGDKCKKILTLKSTGKPKGEVEIYDSARYFTVTGKVFDKSLSEIQERQAEIDELYSILWPEEEERKREVKPVVAKPPKNGRIVNGGYLSPGDIISVIEKSVQGEAFGSLMQGNLEAYGDDHSRGVYALTAIVAFYTGDFQVMEDIFLRSGLNVGKWQKKWGRLGKEQFDKLRSEYELKGDTWEPGEAECSTAEDDFAIEETEVREGKKKRQKKRGTKIAEAHVKLLGRFFDSTRRDLLTGSLHGYKGGSWTPVFLRDTLGALKAECIKEGKPYSPTNIENYLYHHQFFMEKDLLLDIEKWDGRSRIDEMASKFCFQREEISTELFTDILKDWCAHVFRKAYSPRRSATSSRCIILSGSQGIGKDVWIQSFFSAFGVYLSDISLKGRNTTETDIAEVMGKTLVMFISEFDKTKSLDTGMLKDIITKPSFTYRRAYDREASEQMNRCSVIAACNPENILRDVTGNRRFMIFRLEGGPGEAIRWDYPREDSGYGRQILAEMHYLYEQGYMAARGSNEVIDQITAEYTPENPNTELVEEFEQELDTLKATDIVLENIQLFELNLLDQILARLSRNFGMSRRTVLTILKQNGCHYRTQNKRYYGTRIDCENGLKILATKELDYH